MNFTTCERSCYTLSLHSSPLSLQFHVFFHHSLCWSSFLSSLSFIFIFVSRLSLSFILVFLFLLLTMFFYLTLVLPLHFGGHHHIFTLGHCNIAGLCLSWSIAIGTPQHCCCLGCWLVFEQLVMVSLILVLSCFALIIVHVW